MYKQFLYAAKHYPQPNNRIMERVRNEFYKYKDSTDETEIQKALKDGRWFLKEIETVSQIAKYRHLKKNYENKDDDEQNPKNKNDQDEKSKD